MNYNEFMKTVDKKLSAMSEKEKTRWIRNIARITKEHKRIEFLGSLNEKWEFPQVIYEKDKIEKWCEEVEDGEIYFECSGYEVYGEDYWDNDYEYDYYDIFEINESLSKAYDMAKSLLFQKEYNEALLLYNRLLGLQFLVIDRDTGEYNEMELEDVIGEGLIILNSKEIVLNLMYAIYQTADGKDRAAELYGYLTWDMCKDIKIEEIFITGPEEPKGIDSFMKEWISFLKDTDGDRAGELLLEACLYQGGIGLLCEIAREKSSKHPILYKYACEYLLNEDKIPECEKLGLEAIGILSKNLIVRGEIADLTAKAAAQLKKIDIVNRCYEAAFYSESTLNNYLRLFELPDYVNITKEAAEHTKTLPEDSMRGFRNKDKQMMANTLTKDHKDVISFFNGEFDYIYNNCIKDKSTLGWSSGFKGIAVPLFILLLNKDDKITIAGKRIINEIIYRLGFAENDAESFLDKFLNWKRKINLTREQYEKYILWLKEEVDKRTEAVVGGGYRKSYYKAAILIAALGETLESDGMTNGRAVTIEYYKKAHSRKRAFKGEFELLND